MEMYFCPLYSGSSGNALFCQYGGTRLLIDAGKPGSKIEEALRFIGVDPATLDGLLITHEHSDHIAGAGVLARRWGLPLYATRGTWLGMEGKIGKIPGDLAREIAPGRDFYLGDIGVEAFSIPHDALEPVGFRLWGGRLSVSTATDLGHFPREVFERIAGSSLILLCTSTPCPEPDSADMVCSTCSKSCSAHLRKYFPSSVSRTSWVPRRKSVTPSVCSSS